MHAREIGVAAMREGAQQIERRRRLAIGLDLAARIGNARFRRELDAVDDVAAIARQFLAVFLLGRRRARLGELSGDAPDLHHRRAAGECQHHRHLQKDAEEVADVVGAVFGEAFCAIAALQEESLASRDARKLLLQAAGLTCKNQRRKGRELLLDGRQARPCPDNPGPARPAFHASYRASNAQTRNTPCGSRPLSTFALNDFRAGL